MAGPHRRTALVARHLLPSRAEPATPARPLAAAAAAAAPDLLSERGGVDDFTRLGFVHLPGVFTQAEVGTIRREIDAMVAREEMQQEIAAGLNENTLSKVVERSPLLTDMLLADAGPRRYGLLEAVERLLGADRERPAQWNMSSAHLHGPPVPNETWAGFDDLGPP